MGVRKNVDISTGNPSISGYYSIVEGDYDIASNSSTVTLTAYLRRTNNHSGTPTNINNRSITRAFYVDGIEYGSTENISLIIPNDKSYVQFYQKTVTVTHNSDGSKNLSVGFASTCSSNSAFSVPGTDTTLDLTKIPRYGTANQSLLGKDETSISISWSSDSIVDYVWYSIDNGYSWIDVGPTWAYSGSYKISGLNANTGYNIKTKLRRQDSQLATDSSTSYIVTYDWPYITGVSDFTIGNNINFTFYNPLGRNCEFYLQPTNGNEVSIGSNPGTNASVVSTTTINNLLYQASPNNNKNSFAIKLVYGSIIRHGYGNYTIPSSPPTFSNFDYLDVDATIVSITGSNQFIVKNKSNLRVKITSANKMIAKNFATANRYEISCGNRTKSLNYSENETYVDLGTINSAGQMNIIVKAYDSRGFYTQVSKTINVIDYAEPSQSNSLYRINNYENETKLMIEGTYSLVECNGIVKNSIEKIRYRYKKIDGEYGDYKTLIGTMIGNKYSTSQQTLDLDNRYAFVFEIGITDKFGIEVVKEIPLPEGIPIMYINADKKNVGIGCINENGEYSFEVKGKIRADDDIILKSGNTVLDYEFVDESIKLTNNILLDSSGIAHNKTLLKNILNNTGYCRNMIDKKDITKTSNSLVDTRNENKPPKDYRALGVGIYREFKYLPNLGIEEYIFGECETYVYWTDNSGGQILQYLKTSTTDYKRIGSSDDESWEPWKKIYSKAHNNYIYAKLGENQPIYDTNWTKILFNHVLSSFGESLTFMNNGIKIGKGVHKIKVDLTLWAEANQGYCAWSIYKNEVMQTHNISPNVNGSMEIWRTGTAFAFLDVKEGDFITGMVRFSAADNSGYNRIAGFYENSCVLGVQVIN